MKQRPEAVITGGNFKPPVRIHHRRVGVRLMLKEIQKHGKARPQSKSRALDATRAG
jgi:hypothetical protein